MSASNSFTLIVGQVAATVALYRGANTTSLVDGESVNFRWAAKTDFTRYEVMLVPSSVSSHEEGTLIGSEYGSKNVFGEGSFASNTPIETVVTYEDIQTLKDIDGAVVIKVFIKDSLGYWSV